MDDMEILGGFDTLIDTIDIDPDFYQMQPFSDQWENRRDFATIVDLPIDVLLIIFKMVYAMSRRSPDIGSVLQPECRRLKNNTDSGSDSDEDMEDKESYSDEEGDGLRDTESEHSDDDEDLTLWEEEDPMSPSLFPYALTKVCPLWRESLCLVSLFWTRLIIFVGENPTPPSTICTYLTMSGSHPIEITITRRPGDEPVSDSNEQSCVAAALDLLMPHMPRWKSLRVDVLHSMSIPRPHLSPGESISFHPHVGITGVARQLLELRLTSQHNDAPNTEYRMPWVVQSDNGALITVMHSPLSDTQTPEEDEEEEDVQHISPGFRTPKLAILHMDGLAFWSSYLSIPAMFASVVNLTISDHCAKDLGDFWFSDLIRCLIELPNLREVAIIDIELTHGPDDGDILEDDEHFHLFHCTLVGLSSKSVYMLLDAFDNPFLSTLSFKRCTIPGWDDDYRPIYSLELEEMDIRKCFGLLSRCSPTILTVTNCNGVNPLISLLGTTARCKLCICPYLDVLSISRCQGFTSRGLRQMIVQRSLVNRISLLSVASCCMLQQADVVPLRELIDRVLWDGYEF